MFRPAFPRRGFSFAAGLLLAAAPACGSGDASEAETGGTTTNYPEPPGDWVNLVGASWNLGAGTEGYYCSLLTVDEDMYVGAFRALAPEGTHHTVVTLSDSTQPDGEFDCDAGTLSDAMIFASGVGTDDLVLPPGVAFKIPAGKRVLLNLHLYNTQSSAIDGFSGTQVKLIPAAEVEQEAEVIFAGSVLIAVPPMSEGSTTGTCTFNQDATVMSVWPHMHQFGTHMTVTHEGAASTVIHDRPYDFNEQLNYAIDPLLVHAGESMRVDCAYQNNSAQTLNFGDSSDQEMCFAGLYRFPAENNGLFCDIPFF